MKRVEYIWKEIGSMGKMVGDEFGEEGVYGVVVFKIGFLE